MLRHHQRLTSASNASSLPRAFAITLRETPHTAHSLSASSPDKPSAPPPNSSSPPPSSAAYKSPPPAALFTRWLIKRPNPKPRLPQPQQPRHPPQRSRPHRPRPANLKHALWRNPRNPRRTQRIRNLRPHLQHRLRPPQHPVSMLPTKLRRLLPMPPRPQPSPRTAHPHNPYGATSRPAHPPPPAKTPEPTRSPTPAKTTPESQTKNQTPPPSAESPRQLHQPLHQLLPRPPTLQRHFAVLGRRTRSRRPNPSPNLPPLSRPLIARPIHPHHPFQRHLPFLYHPPKRNFFRPPHVPISRRQQHDAELPALLSSRFLLLAPGPGSASSFFRSSG